VQATKFSKYFCWFSICCCAA